MRYAHVSYVLHLIKCGWRAAQSFIISALKMEASSSQQVVQLTKVDVPGALLEEPMDKHSIPALKRWLLCRGIEMASSVCKGQLLDK